MACLKDKDTWSIVECLTCPKVMDCIKLDWTDDPNVKEGIVSYLRELYGINDCFPFKMFDENIANAQKLMVSDAYEMLGMPEDPRYVGWYWAWDPASHKQGLFNEKGERVL